MRFKCLCDAWTALIRREHHFAFTIRGSETERFLGARGHLAMQLTRGKIQALGRISSSGKLSSEQAQGNGNSLTTLTANWTSYLAAAGEGKNQRHPALESLRNSLARESLPVPRHEWLPPTAMERPRHTASMAASWCVLADEAVE